MIVVKYPPIHTGEREIEVRYDEHGMCKVSRELMEILIESYRELVQKDSEYENRRQTIDKFVNLLTDKDNFTYEFDSTLCVSGNYIVAFNNFSEYVRNIAEQMKGESND